MPLPWWPWRPTEDRHDSVTKLGRTLAIANGTVVEDIWREAKGSGWEMLIGIRNIVTADLTGDEATLVYGDAALMLDDPF